MISLDILLTDSRHLILPDDVTTQLGAASQTRLAQIQVTARRQQFLLGRWLMAQAAGCELTMIEEGTDYPIFTGQTDWHASISHSGPYVAVVFSATGRFGLDIEYPERQRDWLALAERAFFASEAQWVGAAATEQQMVRFQRIWTLREAAFKAGLLPHVIGAEAVFDPVSEQACGSLHWQYRQHADLHLSVVGSAAFTITLREIGSPIAG